MDTPLVLVLGLVLPVFLAFGIVELILHFSGYRQLQKDLAAQVTVRTERARGSDLVERALQDLPSEIEIDKHITLLREHLSLLADTLRSEPMPFSSWGQVFQETATALGDLLPVERKVQPLLANKTLHIKPHFDAILTQRLDEVRFYAQKGDEEHLNISVLHLRETVREWTDLTRDWFELRTIASSGIDTVDKFDMIRAHWGWLRHGIENIFVDPTAGQHLVWFPWDVLSRSDLLVKLTNWVAKETTEVEWCFDTVCAMTSTGLPMATLLSTQLEKGLLAIDDKEFLSIPRNTAQPGERILLVDSGIQTGRHLAEATKKAQDERAVIAGAVCICMNDLLPADKTRLPIIEDMLDRGSLIYLFEISDLYQIWKERRWSEKDQDRR